jgi:outer membrane protein assembly factor BamB
VGEPGAERDAAWLTSQNEPGGQVPGRRFSGGLDTTHAVLYALDAETGKELYSSKDLIDSWNHYGGLALSDGRLYLSSYDGRVYAFGLSK